LRGDHPLDKGDRTKPMKILYVGKLYLYDVFGKEKFGEDSPASRRRILGLINGFREQGVMIDVLSPLISSPKPKIYTRAISARYQGSEIVYPGILNIKYLNYFSLLFATLFNMWEMHARNRYDAIIFYNPVLYRGYPSIILGKIKDIQVIMDYEDLVDSEYTPQKWARGLFGIIERHIVGQVKSFILASGNFQRLLPKKARSIVVRSGCYKAKNGEDQTSREPVDKDIILFSGKLDEIRGVDLLIEAANHIKSNNYQIVITSKGPLEEYVKEAARRNKNVIYTGFLSESEYKRVINRATILVNAQKTKYKFSRYCFPSKLYEYMATGKYVISTAVSDVKDGLQDKLFVLDKDDPECLAAMIDHILQNKEKLSYLPRLAQKYVNDYENWGQQAKKIIEFIGSRHKGI